VEGRGRGPGRGGPPAPSQTGTGGCGDGGRGWGPSGARRKGGAERGVVREGAGPRPKRWHGDRGRPETRRGEVLSPAGRKLGSGTRGRHWASLGPGEGGGGVRGERRGAGVVTPGLETARHPASRVGEDNPNAIGGPAFPAGTGTQPVTAVLEKRSPCPHP
jgi:hypothetical protein